MQEVSGGAGPHPDPRELLFAYLVNLAEHARPEHRHAFAAPTAPEQIDVRCQRTWHNIATLNSRLNGGSFTACVARYARDGELYSYFVEAARPAGSVEWACAGASGGKAPAGPRDRAGGFMLAGGSHVCVGGIGAVPDGGLLRVELADGSVHTSAAADGCAIVFAPVTTPAKPDDHVVVRRLDRDGAELGSDRVWMGDGGPPGVRPAPDAPS